jgi:uncharacterized protein YfaS (alpha-2-macroglobulin family)
VDRVKYFRDRSALHRAREEKEILECEMVRTTRSFAVMRELWSEYGKREKARRSLASAAYAFKQAEIYTRLANNTELVQEKAEQKRVIYQQWYVDILHLLCYFSLSFMQVRISNLKRNRDFDTICKK